MSWVKLLDKLIKTHGTKHVAKTVFEQSEVAKSRNWKTCAVHETFGVPDDVDIDDAYAYVRRTHGDGVMDLGLAFSAAVFRQNHVRAKEVFDELVAKSTKGKA